jgi:very-short-patch-repair endonuclease
MFIIPHHAQMIRRLTDTQRVRGRELRQRMTSAESMLWRSLRNRGTGPKFRRQVPIGPYIVDFLCIEGYLVIELDGAPHDDPEQKAYDERRDAWLQSEGWRVLRFSNALVIGGGNIILAEIAKAIATPVGLPSSDPR